MAYLSDIEIAQQCEMKPIMEIAHRAHVDEKYVEQYGRYKAKIDPALIEETDRCGGLSFTGRCRVDGRDQNELAVFLVFEVFHQFEIDLGFIIAV